MKKKVLITTIPFGEVSKEPIELLRSNDIEIVLNHYGRRMTSAELASNIEDVDYLIAGLEPITSEVLNKAKKLKIISRVGVGVENIPFDETKKRGILVTYTPDATTQPAAELVIGFLIDCARRFTSVDKDVRNGKWTKYMGSILKGKTIGIIGVGRIGKTVIKLLKPFEVRILCNDLVPDEVFSKEHGVFYVSKDEIYKESDFLSLNLSYSPAVKHLIDRNVIKSMKPTMCLINTSRGLVIQEDDLYNALVNGKLAGAALDVFEKEPYEGKLIELPNVILTAHIGAATKESRFLMELGATEEIVRFHKMEPLHNQIDHG